MCYFIFANFVAKKGPTPRLWHSNTFCTFQQNPLRESSRIQVNYKKKQKGFIFCGVLEIWSLVARGWQFKKVLPYIKCYFKMQQTLPQKQQISLLWFGLNLELQGGLEVRGSEIKFIYYLYNPCDFKYRFWHPLVFCVFANTIPLTPEFMDSGKNIRSWWVLLCPF